MIRYPTTAAGMNGDAWEKYQASEKKAASLVIRDIKSRNKRGIRECGEMNSIPTSGY